MNYFLVYRRNKMRAPQIILIIVMGIELLSGAYFHGKETKINIWYKLLSAGCLVGILIWGGFFK